MTVDTFLNKDKIFWQELQTVCVAECCGIDAFDFSNKNIIETVQHHNKVVIIKNLDELVLFLERKKAINIHIFLWNHFESRTEFIKRIKNIRQVLLHVSV